MLKEGPLADVQDGIAAAGLAHFQAAYPQELLKRVITVSLETAEIVKGLPKLEFERET